MDLYSYFKERFSWGSNPYTSVEKCRQVVDELLLNPIIPHRISAEAAVCFLSAVRDFAGDGCFVSAEFATIMGSLCGELHTMMEEVAATDEAWEQEMATDGQGEGGGPMYDPGDYEVQPIDEDGDEPDDEPEPDEPDLATLEELYGVNGEPGTTGTRRPFPDWQRCDKWTQADWVNLQVYRDKVLAPVDKSFDYLRPALDTLAAIELHFHRLPLPRQVELSMLAGDLVDGLVHALEANLQALFSKSLYTGEGRRLVQKQLLNVTHGQPENDP